MELTMKQPTASSDFKTYWKKNYFTYVPPAFITTILLVGQLSFGILDSYVNVVVSILTCLLAEIILARLILGTWKNLASAYISGISVGILIRSNMLWPYVFTALISIVSKYVLSYKGRHLWNPSNFGVSWMLYMAPLAVAGLGNQWGSNFFAMAVIWFLGLIIVYRAKRFHVSIAYVISFTILAYVRSLITGAPFLGELSPITGPMYQLFIFFMITDPGVSVSGKRNQVLVVILVAIVEFVLRLNSFVYAPFFALCIVGPPCRFIDLWVNGVKPGEKAKPVEVFESAGL